MMPSGVLASSASARRCSLLRLDSRGDVAMASEVSESLAGGRRVADTGLKNRSERAISLSMAFEKQDLMNAAGSYKSGHNRNLCLTDGLFCVEFVTGV
jgi:hypothetical protein